MPVVKIGELTLEETPTGITLSLPATTPLRLVWKAGHINGARTLNPVSKKPKTTKRRSQKTRVRLNDDQKAQLVTDLIGGMSIDDAMKKFGVHKSTINRVRKAAIAASHA